MAEIILGAGKLQSPPPIRILHIVTLMHRGGIETMLMNYYRHIDRSRLQFDFMVHRDERCAYEDEIEALGGKVYRVHPIHPKYFSVYFSELDRFFKEHSEYKIVHAHIELLSTFALRAAKRGGAPVRISHAHSTSIRDRGFRKLFKYYSRARLKEYYTHCFACSEAAGRYQFGEKLADAGRITLMRNAIDAQKFKLDEAVRQRMRASLRIEGKFVVGHVGYFGYAKNHEFIVEIFSKVAEEDANAVLLLVGEGELQEAIKSKVARMGLSGKVVFAGSVPNVNEYMMAMDAFVFPSRFEGLGIVLIEAQASGLPVVAASNIPKEAWLTPNARLFSLDEPAEKWAKALLECKSFSRKNDANDVVAKAYGIEESAKRLQSFYEEVQADPSCFYPTI